MIIVYGGGTEVDLRNPLYGYETRIRMNTRLQKLDSGGWEIWDNGSSYDSRECYCTFSLDPELTEDLLNIFKEQSEARGLNVDIFPDPGWHPFGPDKGDTGPFQARAFLLDPGPTKGHPGDMFQTRMGFVFNGTYPSWSPPAQVDEGDLQIGTVTGLRYPANMQKQKVEYNVTTTLTEDGTPHAIDKLAGSDYYEATLDLSLYEGNAAALLAWITANRASAISVSPPANAYMFGRENGSTSTYSCNLIQSEIMIKNPIYNRFEFSLTFARVP